MYSARDLAERQRSETLLRSFGTNPEYIPQCKAILDASANPFAQHFAAQCLSRLLTDNTLSSQERPAPRSSATAQQHNSTTAQRRRRRNRTQLNSTRGGASEER